MPIPERIADAPTLPNSLLFYWSAFWELHSCRALGQYPGPIPWTSMADYARTYNLTDIYDIEIFTNLMFAMDKEWHRIYALNNPAPGKKA